MGTRIMALLANNTCIATALAVAMLAVAAAFPGASAQAAGPEVDIDQFSFTPQHVTVKAGTTRHAGRDLGVYDGRCEALPPRLPADLPGKFDCSIKATCWLAA